MYWNDVSIFVCVCYLRMSNDLPVILPTVAKYMNEIYCLLLGTYSCLLVSDSIMHRKRKKAANGVSMQNRVHTGGWMLHMEITQILRVFRFGTMKNLIAQPGTELPALWFQ